jgi:peptide/nickel transport system permease protein
MTILVIHFMIAITSPFWVWENPTEISAAAINQSPDWPGHIMGTDEFGRDVLTRVVLGGRTAMLIVFVAMTMAITWGGLLGITVGFLGGRIDEVVMRVVDAYLAAPYILYLLLVVSILGTGNRVLIPMLGFFYGIAIVRVARAATLDFVARDFITAARARGERAWSIVIRELIPNVADAMAVEFSMRLSWMLLAFSSLSFLGFGVTPPTPDWGLMISDGRSWLRIAPWMTIFPVIALSTLVIGINLTSDGLAKALGLDRSQGAPI